ncbi:hypothetical protein [Amycolatopsis sp. lyj-90]|uniref:wHTH domain-containing protein n=1 Tax=Amycolatopsis sp. lyj-90 TaxID=2789285 RepID=UPI00397C099E
MTPEDLADFCRELKEFFQQSGAPVTSPERFGGPRKSRVSEILNGAKTLPDLDQVVAIVNAGLHHAKAPLPNSSLEYWRSRHAMLESSPPPQRLLPPDHWPTSATAHPAWARAEDKERFHDEVAKIAAHLGERRQAAETALAGSPWLDADLTERVERRVVDLIELVDLRPTGAEAALLVLAPMVHRVRILEAAASHVHVNPTSLRPEPEGGVERRQYERFLEGAQQSRLVSRTELPERHDSVVPIGWWMFHQWATGALDWQLSRAMPLPNPASRELYSTLDRLTKLFHLTPGDLRSRHGLRQEADHLGLTPKPQIVREVLIGLLLVVAWEQAIELTALPMTVVEHIGIPHPVKLEELQTTVTQADWVRVEGVGIGLNAHCQHEAVLEALRSHVGRLDAVLSAVRELAGSIRLEPLRLLPPHASADLVKPATEDTRPVFFTPVTRFRLDETRIRELLMGEQLYGDKSLAIRELYQNALDACRYRKARHEFLRKARGIMFDWAGRIEFKQETRDGRHLLHCTDTGIGMSESELREVFSRAGARFADRPEFLEEQEKWKEEDVEFFPNSRFGIGVLSYFMLADEIEIRTRRMDPEGHKHGEALRVMIAGPGHLFRIEPLDEDMRPGTTVTLYLRDDAEAESCVDILQRLLGIAEFETTATHGDQTAAWTPFRLESRPFSGTRGLHASGELVHGERTDCGQVVWCENGGGLLVDGIHVQPAKRTGVFAGEAIFRGAIVNLYGIGAPRLTVDRSKTLDDVAPLTERLLKESVATLRKIDPMFLSLEWLLHVTRTSPGTADIVALEISRHSTTWRARIGSAELLDGGRFRCDVGLIRRLFHHYVHRGHRSTLTSRATTVIFAHSLLSLSVANNLPPLMPSVNLILETFQDNTYGPHSDEVPPGIVLSIARTLGHNTATIASQLTLLGFAVPEIDWSSLRKAVDQVDLIVTSADSDGLSPWLPPAAAISVMQIINSAYSAKRSPREIAERYRFFGFSTAPIDRLPSRLTRWDVDLISLDITGGYPWLPAEWPADPARVHLLAAILRWEVPAVVARFRELGFTVDDADRTPEWLDTVGVGLKRVFLECAVHDGDSIPRSQVVRAAILWNIPPSETVRRFEGMRLTVEVDENTMLDLQEKDLALLSRQWLDSDMPSGPVRASLSRLHKISEEAGVTIIDAAERLATHGFSLPKEEVWRRDWDPTDRWLLQFKNPQVSIPEWENRRDFEFLLEAARESAVPITEVAERLHRMGFEVPDVTHLSKNLTEFDHSLLATEKYWLGKRPAGSTVPLAFMARAADRTGAPLHRTMVRVLELGYAVPSIGRMPIRLDRLDMDLLSRVGLGTPITMKDVLRQALWFEVSPEEIGARLAALELDVPDIEKELPKIYARVPGYASGKDG